MRKNNAMIITCLFMYIACNAAMYFLGYKELAILLLFLFIIILTMMIVFDDIKLQYKLMNKKAILCADISNSKLIKLYYGNDKKIINDVYDIICHNVRHGFTIRKYTDHFVILTEYGRKTELISLVNRINEDVKDLINDELFNISLKFGIQMCDEGDFESNENKAALACNKAKSLPLNSYCFYEEEDAYERIAEKKVLDELVESLKNNEFEVYYQPKYNHKTNEVVGCEALVRLVKDGNIVPAKDFIDIAEKYGFTVLLDKFVLREVCKKIRDLKKNKIDFKTISVNVSRSTLNEESMLNYYQNVIDQYDVKKSDIELEVTERDPLYNTYSLTKIIHELCKKFNVSVDDFGVGNSSLSMLNENKIKTIKIDREFVIDDSEVGRKILTNMIKLITDLGFDVIAEGVETKEQADFLKKKGCNVIQGYYYSKPLPFEDYLKLLKEDE